MTEKNWKREVEKWQEGKMSMAEFCRTENLSYWTFRQRRKQINDEEGVRADRLVRLKLTDTCIKNKTSKIEIFIG